MWQMQLIVRVDSTINSIVDNSQLSGSVEISRNKALLPGRSPMAVTTFCDESSTRVFLSYLTTFICHIKALTRQLFTNTFVA